jgi:hypothetical protein
MVTTHAVPSESVDPVQPHAQGVRSLSVALCRVEPRGRRLQ